MISAIRSTIFSRREHGFTLLELIIALAIAGLLVGIAVPVYQDYTKRTEFATAIADINRLGVLLEDYKLDNNALPETLDEIGMGGLRDPWGNPYQYLNIATTKGNGKLRKDHNLVPINSDYDLYSMGEDGKSVSALTAKASRDDIVRANNGGYVGLASEY